MKRLIMILTLAVAAGCGSGPDIIDSHDHSAFYDFGGFTDTASTDSNGFDADEDDRSPPDQGGAEDSTTRPDPGNDNEASPDSEGHDDGGADTTAPAIPAAFVANKGWETRALAMIGQAKSTIDVAHLEFLIYDPDISIATALKAAAGRGVKIRVILDDKVQSSPDRITDLENSHANIEAKLDSKLITTHVKLIIADGREVLVGSTNLSKSALYHNNEANLWITEPDAIKEFIDYFNSLFSDSGRTIPMEASWSNRVLPLGDGEYIKAVQPLIESASATIMLVMYDMNQDSWRAETLTSLLTDAANRGVTVRALLERCNEDWASYVTEDNIESAAILESGGVTVRFDEGTAIEDEVVTHAKLLIVDDTVVVYSGNWNNSGLSNNHEAGAVVEGVESVTGAATDWFNTLWNSGVDHP